MKIFFIPALFAVGISSGAFAGIEEGLAAHSKGNYDEARKEWQPLADEGNAEAQYLIGRMYLNQEGVRKDDARALSWFRKAAAQNNAPAQRFIGYMYHTGRGVPQDYDLAAVWTRNAAAMGDIRAQYNLGSMYQFAQGLPHDLKQAVAWYQKAAEQGDAESQYSLGQLYETGAGINKDPDKAIYWYEKAAAQGKAEAKSGLDRVYADQQAPEYEQRLAELYRKQAVQGDANAQTMLGSLYVKGTGVPQDFKQALDWYHKAAEQGHTSAAFCIGNMYRKGQGVPVDNKMAGTWLYKAAKQGHTKAQAYLVLINPGYARDEVQAAMWLKKAAEDGDPEVQDALAGMYRDGRGVPKNIELAEKWFLKAALQGNSTALSNLERMYSDEISSSVTMPDEVFDVFLKAANQGDVVAQEIVGKYYFYRDATSGNQDRAIFWYRKAAEQGDMSSQIWLGLLYQRGDFCPKDLVMAHVFFTLMAKDGNSVRVAMREGAAKEMSPKQLAESKAIVASWKPGDALPIQSKTGLVKAVTSEDVAASGKKQAKVTSPQLLQARHETTKLKACNPPSGRTLRYSDNCYNGDCIRTFENGCQKRFQAPYCFDPFTSTWNWKPDGC